MRLTLLFILLSWAWQTDANPYQQQLDLVLETLSKDDTDHWAFTLEESVDEVIRISVFDPRHSLNKGWTLVSINGKSPTQQQADEFYQVVLKQEDEDETLIQLIKPNSISYEGQQGEQLIYSFQPELDEFEDDEGSFEGQLMLERETGNLTSLSIQSTESFSPEFSVKINSFTLTFKFDTLPQGLIITQLVTEVSGSYAFVNSFEETSVQTFRDYQWISATPKK